NGAARALGKRLQFFTCPGLPGSRDFEEPHGDLPQLVGVMTCAEEVIESIVDGREPGRCKQCRSQVSAGALFPWNWSNEVLSLQQSHLLQVVDRATVEAILKILGLVGECAVPPPGAPGYQWNVWARELGRQSPSHGRDHRVGVGADVR